MLFKAGDEDTICALSTPPGSGGIAVVRVSGLRALKVSRQICRFLPENPESHRLFFGICRGLGSDDAIDEVVVSFFAHGRSFTGEETTEISCHGGPTISSLILKELVKAGCRMARRGEFTYRAFMNGRLDLVQAESVLSLIESQTRQSAKAALRQLQGHLSHEFHRIEDDLVWMLAHLEASIDFSTEGLEVVSTDELLRRGENLRFFVSEMIKSYGQGRILREGLQIALVGRPNAGKSSLLNALVREEKAIVTAHAGTTRDLIEGLISVGGVPVTFVDTAGLRETENEIERLGIERSRQAMDRADLVFFVLDITEKQWMADLNEFLVQSPSDKGASSDKRVVIFNKSDLDHSGALKAEIERELVKLAPEATSFWTSAISREGLPAIEEMLARQVAQIDSESSNIVTQARHLELLQKIHSCLDAALRLINEQSSPEFIAFELQDAVRAIHELLGKEFDEQVIDRIFKEFCLGK